MKTLRIALLAALVVAGPGCVSRSLERESPFRSSSGRGAATLTVQNNNWLDVVVYVVEGGAKTSILRASTNRTVSADIPANLVKNGVSLRLVADFVGTVDDYWSERVFLRPGQELSWRLEEHLPHSALWINP